MHGKSEQPQIPLPKCWGWENPPGILEDGLLPDIGDQVAAGLTGEEASPIDHVKAGAIPAFLYYTNPPRPLQPITPCERSAAALQS